MVDYTDKKIKCITSKYGNFTKDKLYQIKSKNIYTNGKPASFIVIDDEGDLISVESLLRKPNKFILF